MTFDFHPEALEELGNAAGYYAEHDCSAFKNSPQAAFRRSDPTLLRLEPSNHSSGAFSNNRARDFKTNHVRYLEIWRKAQGRLVISGDNRGDLGDDRKRQHFDPLPNVSSLDSGVPQAKCRLHVPSPKLQALIPCLSARNSRRLVLQADFEVVDLTGGVS